MATARTEGLLHAKKRLHLLMPLFVSSESQFLHLSHSSHGQGSSIPWPTVMGLAHVNKAESAFVCPCHLSLHFLQSTLCAGQGEGLTFVTT